MMAKILPERVSEWLWWTTDRKGVMKNLADTKWNWLRTASGLKTLVVASLFVMFAGPTIVWFVNDGGVLTLVLVASIFSVWFLLRRAVRLVADAPDDALDERLEAIRNRAYLGAYLAFANVVSVIATAFLIWSIAEIRAGVMSVGLLLTWPQVNAVIWFVLGQVLLWPSVLLAIALLRKKVVL